MANGSRILVAEAFLHPTGINYRVATGPGWAALGGTGQRWGRWFAVDSYPDTVDALVTEAQHALYHIRGYVDQLARWADTVSTLPLGELPDVVRSAPQR